jgi:predicted secreted protein
MSRNAFVAVRIAAVGIAAAITSLAGPASRALAYPGGTPSYVTDVAPYCASCHSSVSEEQLAGVPAPRVLAELAANKHIAKIQTAGAGSPYNGLTDVERQELIAGIQKIDAATRITLSAPATAKAGDVIDVVVEVTGGSAPVLGIALVDANQRWQASPATSAGWQVTGKPVVTGPDGKPQTKFTDGRNPTLRPGTTYVNVDGIMADPLAGKFSTVKVAWKLRAPAQAGPVPLAAVLLYGTEMSSPHGSIEMPQGKGPVGGFTGSSGRVKFSDVQTIAVK